MRMSELTPKQSLILAAERFIEDEYNCGRIPSDANVADRMCSFDSHCLNNENLHLVGELSKELCPKYVKECRVYKANDWQSYTKTVLDKGLVSTNEHNTMIMTERYFRSRAEFPDKYKIYE